MPLNALITIALCRTSSMVATATFRATLAIDLTSTVAFSPTPNSTTALERTGNVFHAKAMLIGSNRSLRHIASTSRRKSARSKRARSPAVLSLARAQGMIT